MVWTPEQRQNFLRGLDAVDANVRTFYKYFLYALTVAVTGAAYYLHRAAAHDVSHSYLDFFIGILYLLFLLWAAGQLFAIRQRETMNWRVSRGEQGSPKFDLKLDRDSETGARTFSFHFGSVPPPSSLGVTFGSNLSSLSNEEKPDADSVAQADAYLSQGSPLDVVCRLINPRYKDWSMPQQEIYKAHLRGAVEFRRTQNPVARGEESNSVAASNPRASASPAASTSTADGTDPAGTTNS